MTDTIPAYGLWGLVIIMFGFLLQWPTLVTLVMFPILLLVYANLAKWEEQDMLREFGEAYERYRRSVPAFIPHLRSISHTSS